MEPATPVQGTLVIVFIFLAWFIVLYVLQWAFLAVNWPIR